MSLFPLPTDQSQVPNQTQPHLHLENDFLGVLWGVGVWQSVCTKETFAGERQSCHTKQTHGGTNRANTSSDFTSPSFSYVRSHDDAVLHRLRRALTGVLLLLPKYFFKIFWFVRFVFYFSVNAVHVWNMPFWIVSLQFVSGCVDDLCYVPKSYLHSWGVPEPLLTQCRPQVPLSVFRFF